MSNTKGYNIRSTVISPGAVDTDLPASVGAEGAAESIDDASGGRIRTAILCPLAD
jgi:NADP-dependent 3-hydroxy acid dehydrogenase YdfG